MSAPPETKSSSAGSADRWKKLKSIDEGGQSQVFLVQDLSGEIAEPCVLKRIKNPKRHDRFVAEVEALKRLNHQYVIKLYDHSDLDHPEEGEKPFLVMPYASVGNLDRRAAIYAKSIDTTTRVVLLLADALHHAHRNGIIHLDVKPANVLFNREDHECLLADFGVCLIRDFIRPTEEGEVVGPRGFIAPELEDGGKLDATPAADVYSLGKVAYFMLTGGVILPRERLYEQKYRAPLDALGFRGQMLLSLLGQMICDVSKRLPSMENIIEGLNKIAKWDSTSSSRAVSTGALENAGALLQRQDKTKREHEQRAANVAEEDRRWEALCTAVTAWLRDELARVASELTELTLNINVMTPGQFEPLEFRYGLKSNAEGRDLGSLRFVDSNSGKAHTLSFYLCRLWTIGFSRTPAEPADGTAIFVAYYDRAGTSHGFIASAGATISYAKTFPQADAKGAKALFASSKVSAWPLDVDKYKDVISRGVEAFLKYLGNQAE